jgi:hypothetical protein
MKESESGLLITADNRRVRTTRFEQTSLPAHTQATPKCERPHRGASHTPRLFAPWGLVCCRCAATTVTIAADTTVPLNKNQRRQKWHQAKKASPQGAVPTTHTLAARPGPANKPDRD